jgi:hypothetical protein
MEKLIPYIIGTASIIFLMIGWVAIQTLWRKVFSEHVTDEDAMAERTTCGNCACKTVCENKSKNLNRINSIK